MDLGRIERDIRRVPGVLACQLTAGELTVLVAPDADPVVVSAAVRRALADVAAAPAFTVLGGRGVAPARRHRRGVFALSATSVALLGAAGVAAAMNGVLDDGRGRPSLGASLPPGPPATVPPTAGEVVPSLRADEELAVAPPFRTTPGAPGSSVQPPAQLAALGSPALLVFDLPVPGRAVRPPRVDKALPGPVIGAVPTSPPAPPAPAVPAPLVAAPTPASTTTTLDLHDNDRGQRTDDSNGHVTKGPQKVARGRGD